MKKFLFVFLLGIICVLGGFAAWFSYSFNAETYRERIIKTFSQVTGRQVNITGPVSLDWSPFPTLSISNLTVANQQNSKTPVMLNIEQIRAEIEWGSLFKEPLVIKKVVLEKPTLLLERLRSYETNFDFPILFKTAETIDPSFLNGQNDFSLSIDAIEVRNGIFTYDNVISGEKMTFNGIDGIGVMTSLEGPFSFSGSFFIADKPKKVELRIGKIELSQNLPITLNLIDVASETTIESSGSIFYDAEKPDDWLTLSGVIGSKNASLFFQNLGVDKWPSGALVGSFTLKLMTNKTTFESITVRQGEGENETSFFLGDELDEESQKKRPTLVVKNMNYDEWKPLLSGVVGTSFFDKLNTDFHLQVEEAKINQGSLTQGVAQGHLENGVFTFSALTAQLPFNSSLGLTGTWTPKGRELDAEIQLQTSELRSLLNWAFDKKTDFLPKNGVKNAQFIGHLALKPNKIESVIKVGMLDETEFSGKVNALIQQRSDINADLEIKNLNLDKYMDLTLQDLMKNIALKTDLNFNIKAENLTFNQTLLGQISAVGLLKDNQLSLKEFTAKMNDNSNIRLVADFQNLSDQDMQIKDLNASFEIPNLSNFTLKNNPFHDIPLEIKGTLGYSGQLTKGDFQTEITFNQALLKMTGIIENPFENMKFTDTSVSLTHSDVQNFLSSFKNVKLFLPYLSGKLQISFNGNGTKDSFFAQNLLLSAGNQSLKGEANFALDQKTIQATLTSSELDLNKFLPPFEEIKKMSLETEISPDWLINMDISADKLIYDEQKYTSFKTKLNLKDQILNIPSLGVVSSDKVGSLTFTGRAVLKKPIILDGKFNLNNIAMKEIYTGENFSLEGGRLNLSGNFVASGNSWGGFTQSLRSDGQISWENGLMRGINMNELSSAVEKSLKQYQSKSATTLLLQHALSKGSTNITSATGSFQVEQGEMKIPEFKTTTNSGEIFIRNIKWPFLTQKVTAILAFGFKKLQNFPSLDAQLQNGKIIPQTEVFEKALEQEAKSLQKQYQDSKEKMEQQQAEEKRNEILMKANDILAVSENQIAQMKDMMALRSSEEGEELMTQVSATLEEVRSLAVRPDLNAEQLTMLQEKANLLNLKSQELKNFLNRQDVLRQRDAVQKLPPLVKNRITELIQIYNQNSQSAVMAGLVQGSQKEEEKITQNLALLSQAEEIEFAQKLIDEIKASFQKIQKALNYARQLDLTGSVSLAGE